MKEAERGYVKAIALSERAGDLHNAAMMSCNLGTLSSRRDDFGMPRRTSKRAWLFTKKPETVLGSRKLRWSWPI